MGIPLMALNYTTPQFGSDWGVLTSTAPNSISSQYSLDQLMTAFQSFGLHAVETIPSTNEGIAAGTWKDLVVLVHAKLSQGGKVDLTVKCNDQPLSANLS